MGNGDNKIWLWCRTFAHGERLCALCGLARTAEQRHGDTQEHRDHREHDQHFDERNAPPDGCERGARVCKSLQRGTAMSGARDAGEFRPDMWHEQ